MLTKMLGGLALVLGLVVAAGAQTPAKPESIKEQPAVAAAKGKGCCCCMAAAHNHEKADDEALKVARAKLSKEDLALVEAQEYCVVDTTNRLGAHGVPVKLTIKNEAVFICCKGCEKGALADADKTLAKLKELKARVAKEKAGK